MCTYLSLAFLVFLENYNLILEIWGSSGHKTNSI